MKLLLNALCLLLLSVAAFAQSDRGTITGTVPIRPPRLCPAPRSLPKTLENGAIFETTTTVTGNFTLASLPAGQVRSQRGSLRLQEGSRGTTSRFRWRRPCAWTRPPGGRGHGIRHGYRRSPPAARPRMPSRA